MVSIVSPRPRRPRAAVFRAVTPERFLEEVLRDPRLSRSFVLDEFFELSYLSFDARYGHKRKEGCVQYERNTNLNEPAMHASDTATTLIQESCTHV